MPRRARGWNVFLDRSGKSHRCRWSGIYGTGQKVFVFKADAREFAVTKRQDFERMAAGLPPAFRAAGALTVESYAKTYLENSKREKSAKTYRNFHKPAVESFCAMFGNRAIASITDEDVRAWKAKTEDSYGGTTANIRFRDIATFLNAAVKAGHLTKSPARHVSRPAEGPGGRALTDGEYLALIAVAPEALYRTAVFSANTMLRIGEVCAFDWSQVSELENGSWMGRIPAGTRKTRNKVKLDCVFPINAAARGVMGSRKDSGRVFEYSPWTIQHQLVEARKAAKLPDDITFHCLRHTGASRYLREGGHMEDLLKSRLWNDPRSLLRYVHVEEITLSERFSRIKYPHLTPKSKKAANPV